MRNGAFMLGVLYPISYLWEPLQYISALAISIFDLIMMEGQLVEIRVRDKKGAEALPEKDKRTAEEFIKRYHKNIIEKWVKNIDLFVQKK